MLLLSVAPLVKIISFGSAPIRSATSWKQRRELQTIVTVVRNPKTRNRIPFKNKPWHESDYLSSFLHRFLCLPAVRMSSRVGVSVRMQVERHHRIENPWVLEEKWLRSTTFKATPGLSHQWCSGHRVKIQRSQVILGRWIGVGWIWRSNF